MTLPEIKGFLDAIHKRAAREHIMYITNTAVASQGDAKAMKKTIKVLAERT